MRGTRSRHEFDHRPTGQPGVPVRLRTDIESDTIPPGLTEDTVRFISAKKSEPEWLLEWRLKAFRRWLTMTEPHWPNVTYPPIDYQAQTYYSAPKTREAARSRSTRSTPKLLETYEKLGISLNEQKRLTGVAVDAIFDSVSVGTTYQGGAGEATAIIFCSFGEAVHEHPELVQKYLGSVVPYRDNFFAALNSAVFSDGSFVLHPQGREVPDGAVDVLPHQRRRHGAVRAHADRRRRGLAA